MVLTILTPTLNCAKTLLDTLRSVEELHQCIPGKVEHLIGDAGSTDGTTKIISQYIVNNSWATSYSLLGLNIPATLNQLLQHASGKWVVVLNGDDFFEIENMVSLLNDSKMKTAASILCGQVSVLSADGKRMGYRDCRLDQIDRYMSVNHPALLVDRRLFYSVGMFDETTPVAYDYVWVWRAFRANAPFIKYPITLAAARLGGISHTRTYHGAKEIFRTKMNGGMVFPALRDYMIFLLKYYLRKPMPNLMSSAIARQFKKIKGSIDHY